MPGVAIHKWIKSWNRQAVTAMISATIMGVMTHLFIMTNKIFNYNEMSILLKREEDLIYSTTREGRWFAGILGQVFGGSYSMQFVTGILGILVIAISAGLVVYLLEMKNSVYAALIGASMAVFPALVSFMAFTQLGDAWFFAVFFAVLAVYLCERVKWGQFYGLVLIGLSLAIHQAYVSVAIAFMFVLLFYRIYEKQSNLKELLPTIGKYVIVLAGGFAFYYIGVKITTAMIGTGLTDYHGISEMTSFTIRGICKGIVYCYLYFFEYFFTTRYLFSWVFVGLDMILALILLVFCVKSICKSAKSRRFMNMALKIVMLCVLPIGLNGLPALLADRVGAGVDRYMMYSIVFLWVLMLKLADNMELELSMVKNRVKQLGVWCILIGVGIHIVHDVVMDNQAYVRVDAVTTSTTEYLNRIAARMEGTEGWNSEIPVYLVGCNDLFAEYDVAVEAYEDLAEFRGTAYEPSYNEQGIKSYLEGYLHFPVVLVTVEQREVIDGTAELEQMGCYPAADSVQIIEGVLVVKISNIEN